MDIFEPYRKLLKSNSNIIPAKHKDEFDLHILFVNIFREKALVYVLVLINAGLIMLDLNFFRSKWEEYPAYINLLIYHCLAEIWYFMFLVLCNFHKRNAKYNKYLHYTNCIINLAINIIVSINAQNTNGHIYAYVICVFLIMTILAFKNHESILILLISWIILIAGLILTVHDPIKLSSNVINSFLVMLTAYVVSRVGYTMQAREFLVKKVLIKKSEELDILNKKLEIRIEERSKLLDKTIEIDRLRTAFFTNISHELKTPLSVILSAHQLLDIKLDKLLNRDDYLNVHKQQLSIRQNSYRLIRLLNNLLDITRIDAGNYRFVFKNYNIVKLVKDILNSVTVFIENHKLNVTFDTSIKEKVISCDADMIERVILNLLANAVKFTPANGTISVGISTQEGFIAISIKDTGVGIPYDMQKLVFERFIQVDSSLTRNREGSGIGLSLVKSIIDNHKGTIDLISKPGQGSEFIIRLPDEALKDESNFENEQLISSNRRVERLHIEFSDIYDIS